MRTSPPVLVYAAIALSFASVAQGPALADGPKGAEEIAREVTPRLRPQLRAEFEFAVATCRLSDDQRRRLARDSEATLGAIARAYGEARVKNPRADQEDALPDCPALIRSAFPALVVAAASPEQAARYAEESRLREADRRAASVAIVVAKLDHALALAPDQREALARSLRENWSEAGAAGPEAFIEDDVRLVPPIPDRLVLPVLEPGQAASWKAAMKAQPRVDLRRLELPRDDRPLDGEGPR